MVRKITKDSFKPLVLKGLSHATNNCYYIPITKVDEIFSLIQDYQSKYTLSITINEQVPKAFAFLNVEYYLFCHIMFNGKIYVTLKNNFKAASITIITVIAKKI